MSKAKHQPTSDGSAQRLQDFSVKTIVQIFPSGPGHEHSFIAMIRKIKHNGDVGNKEVIIELDESHPASPARRRSLGGGTSAKEIK